jgi:hypothetical protein
MFIDGDNGREGSPLQQSNRIATAYLAYDCNSNIVCAAAFLDELFLLSHPYAHLKESDDNSWIRFGPNDGETKLKESNSETFEYVSKPNGSEIIGWEGCWNIDLDDPKMQSVVNNYVELHFTHSPGIQERQYVDTDSWNDGYVYHSTSSDSSSEDSSDQDGYDYHSSSSKDSSDQDGYDYHSSSREDASDQDG